MKKEETSLKAALKAMMEQYRLESGSHEARIRQLWPELFGPSLSANTRRLRVVDHKLFVSVDSAALRQELTMTRELLRQKLNRELGEEFLKEVVIR
jgi:predicted nucleic acid-binding Zn ribbon protein